MHLNDGSDGSLEWVKSQGIKYTHSSKNIGVCLAVNHAVAQAQHDRVRFMNGDMVAAPGMAAMSDFPHKRSEKIR